MLEIKNLHAYYGKSHVLHGVDMHVDEGEIVSLLGRNGVGRSTTVKATMGQVAVEGSIKFKGEDITGLKAFEIAHKGLGYVPENRDIFPTLTVEQNLILGEKKGSGVNEFNLPHAIQVDRQGNVYVADRTNNRYVVLDNNLKWKTAYTNVGTAWTACVSQGPHQYLFVSNSNPNGNRPGSWAQTGQIYKVF